MSLPIPDKFKQMDRRRTTDYFYIHQEDTTDVFTVAVKHDCWRFTEILVGSDDDLRGCVIINLTRHVDYDLWEAFLNVEYTDDRNIMNDVSSCAGTISLLRAAFSFVFTYFPISEIILKDISTFICGPQPAIHSPIFHKTDNTVTPPNTYEIFLSALYILKYGTSFYETHFQAHFNNDRLRANLEKYKLFINTRPEWSYLYDKYISHDIWDKNKHIETVLYDAWSRTDSFRDFVLDVISDHDQSYFLLHWFDEIFNEIVCTGYYTDVDHVISYADFQFSKGMTVSYITTGYGFIQETCPSVLRIEKNEQNSKILGGNVDNAFFNKMLYRRPNPK